MSGGDIKILAAHEVRELLTGCESELLCTVQRAYETHARGESALPHSTFLHVPDQPRDRIIALPAYLGQEFGIAGIKWIASFPENNERGMERASAVIIVNSSRTGRPEAILEGSIISAKRTAASAALAARHLHGEGRPRCAGLIGCGLINLEIAGFLRVVFPTIEAFIVYDACADQAASFKRKVQARMPGVDAVVARDVPGVLGSAALCSLATTATEPHIHDLAACVPGSTLLHVSLRDLSPQVILACDNIVDDVDHVCRARTSIHLTEQLVGDRAFIRCTLADVTTGAVPARRAPDTIAVFSPFGLGVLDLAVSQFVLSRAHDGNHGTTIRSFLPGS